MNLKRSIKKRARKLGAKLGLIAPPPKAAMDREEIEADRAKYIAMNTDKDFLISKEFDYICPGDKYANNGAVDSGYFIQDIWGARKVAEFREYLKGQNILHNFIHYDVGSSVGGFIAHLQALHQEVCLIDIRPMQSLKSRFLETGGGGEVYTSRCYKPRWYR